MSLPRLPIPPQGPSGMSEMNGLILVPGPGGSSPRPRPCAPSPRSSNPGQDHGNISVGPPFDLLCCRRDSLKAGRKLRIDGDEAYFTYLHKHWADGLRGVFDRLHDPDWAL